MRELVATAFRAAYSDRYRRPPPSVPIELVHARVTRRGARGAEGLKTVVNATVASTPDTRRIVVDGLGVEASVYQRTALPVGFSVAGPALVQEAGSTLIVGPAGRFRVLPSGNILVEIG